MSNKILVGNLLLDATEESLREHVESIGKVRKIVMPQNRKGQLLGFAQITLSDRAEAIKAQNL
ncbi:hypothetical protein ACQJ1I_24890, partial [Klebsiella quasipneumoniae]|uniref:hypothetical protein n=1 Tax=Klebsiella quasipneumoniae TaxID=1463165 RepID=UPI003D057D27